MRISDWSSDVCSSDLPEGSETRHNIILRQIAFAHSMRCQLRRQSPYEDIARIAGTDVADMAVARLNPANALLEDISGNYADGLAAGRITEIQQASVERVLIDIANAQRSEEHTSELKSLMRISYAVFCLKKKNNKNTNYT